MLRVRSSSVKRFEFLGGLSLHLNHLIAEHMSAHYWQFGTLPIGIFLSNLVSGQLDTSLMTSYCHFWNLSTFGNSRAVWVFWPKLGVFRKSKFSRWRSDEASMQLGVLGSQITRLYDGTIFGGGATHLRGSRGPSKKLKLKNWIFWQICDGLKGIRHLLISSRISP